MDEEVKDKLLVKVEDDDADASEQHPSCSHGPTVLFYRKSQSDGFFACSAHRKPKLCDFRMDRVKWRGSKTTRLQLVQEYPKLMQKIDPDPTIHLKALSQDEVHAQYFFDANALTFFEDQCGKLTIKKVVCIGTPRLHFHLRRNKSIKTFLLDFDERFAAYLSPQEFCLYNMCNNHFCYPRQPFEMFLKCNGNERILIVTDPPFACRTELIAHTLCSLKRLYNRIHCLPATPLSIFWVYPYYMANYIKQDMPELEMCEYKLNYTNHSRYTNVGPSSRVYGSPVRVFTNVPLQLLELRSAEGYKYCSKCFRYTAGENTHCDRCQNCCSQNGQSYRHCPLCDKCVKPNYVHCSKCRRCSQWEGHSCHSYQSKQRCWICGQLGHIETNCDVWLKLKSKRRKKLNRCFGCLICGQQDHREHRCTLRHKYFKETQFMGQILTVPRRTVGKPSTEKRKIKLNS